MKNKKVLYLLSTTLLTLTLIPMVSTIYFFDRTLETTLNLGFNGEVSQSLSHSTENLKKLKSLDPQNEGIYRSQFEKARRLLNIYGEADLVKEQIESSLKIYFWFGLLIALTLSLLFAIILSRKIHQSYQSLFSELIVEKEKVRYLEDVSSWQELAKMLAHEIKNPLTPIEVLMGSLGKSFLAKDKETFGIQLEKTQDMVYEELHHLKSLVNRFSEFSKVPDVSRKSVIFADTLRSIIENIKVQFPQIQIEINDQSGKAHVALDKTLFRQIIANLVKNGVEANKDKILIFQFNLSQDLENNQIVLQIQNDGLPVPSKMATRLFDPYVSTKSNKENMGLGLTIVKKVIIEHEGSIDYLEKNNQPCFTIRLPKETQ